MSNGAITVDYTFEWPAGPEEVIVTGEFDQWKGSLPLLQTSSGDFELTFPVKVPADKDRVFFKFIVDGNWVTSDAYSKGFDENGIENNFISKSEAQTLNENPVAAKIPEAGGLTCSTASARKDEDDIPEPGAYPKTTEVSKTVDPAPAPIPAPIPVPEGSASTTSASKKNKNRKKKEKKKAKARAAKAAAGLGVSGPTPVSSAPNPEPGAVPLTSETSETDDTEFSTPEPSATPAATPEPVVVKAPEAAPAPTSASKTKKPKVTETTTVEITGVITDEPILPGQAVPQPAAIPVVAVETIEKEIPKPIETPAVTEAPQPKVTSAVPEVGSPTTASKGVALEPAQTLSSHDSKKKFKILRRFKKNKLTGEKIIVSEERIPLSSEESGSEQPIVDEELVDRTETSKSEDPAQQTASNEVHILPIDASENKTKEYTAIVGGPGPVVPQNAAEIKEFSEVRDVDTDELNERLNKQEKEKDLAKTTAKAEVSEGDVTKQTLDPKTQQHELEKQRSNKLYEVENGDSEVVKPETGAEIKAGDKAVPAETADKKAQTVAEEKVASSKTEKTVPVKKSAAAAPKQEEKKKKKGGFFSKLKKIFQ